MHRTIKILCFLSAMQFAFPAMAFTTSPDGGSGNLTSQSSDTLPSDEMISYGFLGLDDFYSSNTWQHEMQMVTGVYMGLSNRSEAGIGLSLANNSSTLATGYAVRYFRAHGKYRFYGSRNDGQAASLYFYTTSGEVPDKPSLASGQSNTGMQLIYSTYDSDSSADYVLGMDTRDYKIYSGGIFSYDLVPVLSLSASRTFYTSLDRSYELGIKAESATVNHNPSGNVYVVLAAHFNTNEALRYSAGALLDTPGGVGVLKARYFVGFSYRSKFSASKTAHTSAPIQTSKPPVVEASKMVKPKPVVSAAPKVDKNTMAISAKPCLANVEIMDMSGIKGLGEKVAEELRGKGYCVPSIYTEGSAMSFFSQLYFAKGKEAYSTDITKTFNVKGSVTERTLPSGVDIRFIVGRDQQ